MQMRQYIVCVLRLERNLSTLGCVVIAGIVGPGDRAVAFNLLAWLSRPQQLDINANGQPMQDTSKQQNY